MLLWVFLALMTGAAVLAVLLPLARRSDVMVSASDHATAVYKDQLREIERDLERGLVAPGEAKAARAEIARRLLASADQAGRTEPAGGTSRRRLAALVALVAVPGIALGTYLQTGRPNLPAAPLAARLETPVTPDTDIGTLVRRVELALQRDPNDGRGWDVIAPVYLRMQRPREAILAFGNAIRIVGSSADRQFGLGQAHLMLSGGVINADAKAAFQAALRDDPRHALARAFVARAADQDGEPLRAIAEYTRVLADSPPGAPWIAAVQQEIARLGGGAPQSIPVQPAREPPAAPGPSSDDVAAAERMAPADRDAMVRGMVTRLADRLKENGDDPEGWMRLVRAYSVLGERDRALSTAGDARRALAHRPEASAALDRLLRDLGLGG